MNSDQAQGKAKQVAGKIKETWGKLTDDDVALYHGQKEKFFGHLQETYGIARDQAEKTIKAFEDGYNSKSSDEAA